MSLRWRISHIINKIAYYHQQKLLPSHCIKKQKNARCCQIQPLLDRIAKKYVVNINERNTWVNNKG